MKKKLLLTVVAFSAAIITAPICKVPAASVVTEQTATLCDAKNTITPFKVSCTFKIRDGNTGKTYNISDKPELTFGEHQLICNYKISCKVNIPQEVLAKMGDNSFGLYDGKIITKENVNYTDDGDMVFVNTGKKNKPKKFGKCAISIRIMEDDPSMWDGEK